MFGLDNKMFEKVIHERHVFISEQKDKLLKRLLTKAGYNVNTLEKIINSCKNIKSKIKLEIIAYPDGREEIYIENKYYGTFHVTDTEIIIKEV